MKILLALSALTLVGAAQANLVTNGGFELPATPVGTYVQYFGGSTGITGWTVTGNDVDTVEQTYTEPGQLTTFNPSSGAAYLDLTGAGNSGTLNGVNQDLATVAGQTYTLSFDISNSISDFGTRPYQAPSIVDLSLDGGTRISFSLDASGFTPGQNYWKTFTVNFVADGSTTNVAFFSGYGGSDNNNIGLDNVSVEAVPEPASMAVLGLGLAALKRRRKNG